MTDARGDPRYIRMIGLSLLAALLVVASCQVEQLSITVEVEQTTPEALAEAVDRAERLLTRIDEFGVEEPPPTTPEVEPPLATDEQERARAAADATTYEMERLRAAVDEAILEARERIASRPPPPTDDGGTDLGDPRFTPMTVRPELRNRNEVMQALMREYPVILRDAGVGGQVVVWFFISETGQVRDKRIFRSSGHQELDDAALRVADVYRFTPAMNRSEPVQVWIQLPITFQVR